MKYYRGKSKHTDIMTESSHILVSPDPKIDLDIMCAEFGITAETRDEKIERVNQKLKEDGALGRFRDGHKGERLYTPIGMVAATTEYQHAHEWALHQAKYQDCETVVVEFLGEYICDLADGVLVKVAQVVAEHEV